MSSCTHSLARRRGFDAWPTLLRLSLRYSDMTSIMDFLDRSRPMSEFVRFAREMLPIVRKRIYLDNAGLAPISIFVRDAIVRIIDARCMHGKDNMRNERTRSLLRGHRYAAELLNASEEEIALTHNTTEGLNIVAQGFPWRPGDNLLLPDNEFPANVYPWLALRQKGVEVRRVPTRAGAFSVDDIAPMIDGRTRMLSISHVGYISGFRADLEAIGRLCHERGVRFVVDAAQSMGVLDIDVQSGHIDALASGSWKWLMGPTGVGLLFVSNGFLDELQPTYIGAGSMQAGEGNPAVLPGPFVPGARRFEISTEATVAVAGLTAAMAQIRAVGVDRIQERVAAMVRYLRNELRHLGYEIAGDTGDDEHLAGIVSARLPGLPLEQLRERLTANQITCGAWHGYVRFAPHYYNTWEELEILTTVLAEATAAR